jgi:protein O-mannosyl-transferase
MKNKKVKNKPKGVSKEEFRSFIPVKSGLIAIALMTIIAYSPVFTAEFTNWDDQGYVTENPVIKNLNNENFKLIFTESFVANYHPLTMLSLALDYAIAGESSVYFHTVNLLLHLINSFLVFYFVLLLFRHLKLPHYRDFALMVAALFAVHTLHVESVAWISERKDLLYSMFFLGALIAYSKYALSKRGKFFIFAFVLFIFSLFSKGQAITLSVSLLAIDYILERKLWTARVLIEKTPFFILSILFGVIALRVQAADNALAATVQQEISFFDRMLFASYGYIQYHWKLIVPTSLSAIYPYPPKIDGGYGFKFYLYFSAALIMIIGLIQLLRKNKLAGFGMLFFLLNIAVVIQLVPVGSAIMADRYSYLPSIGLYTALVAGIIWLLQRKKVNFKVFLGLAASYLLILSSMTYNRTKIWDNSMTLWNDVLRNYDYVQIALNNRGNLHYEAGRNQAALNDFNRSIEVDPKRTETYNNRGSVKAEMGDYEGALADYNKSLIIDPDFAQAHYGAGGVYLSMNHFKEAIAAYDKAIRMNPDYAEAYSNRANAKINLSKISEAMSDYNKALELKPDYAEAYANRGIARVVAGDYSGAIDDYSMAIRLDSSDALAYYLRGLTYESLKKNDMACKDFDKASRLGFQAARQKKSEFCR